MATLTLNPTNSSHKVVVYTIDFSESNVGSATENNSRVNYTVKVASGGWSSNWYSMGTKIGVTVTVNGSSETFYLPEYNHGSKGKSFTMGSGYKTVEHNSDGSKSVSISASCFDSTSASYTPGTGGTTSASDSMTLTKIPRYTSISSFSVSPVSGSTAKLYFSWSTADIVDYLWYSTNNGSSWNGYDTPDGTSGGFEVGGLSANSSYNCKIRVRRRDSQLTTDYSSYKTGTTYNSTTFSTSVNSFTETSITYTATSNQTLSSKTWTLKNSSGTTVATKTDNVNSVTFSGLSPGTLYKLTVSGVSSTGSISGSANAPDVTTYSYPYLINTPSAITIDSSKSQSDTVPSTLKLYNPRGLSCTIRAKLNNSSGDSLYSESYSTQTGTGGADKTINLPVNTLRSKIQSGTSANIAYYLEYSTQTPVVRTSTFSITGNEIPTFTTSNWTYSTNFGVLTNNDDKVIIKDYSTVNVSITSAPTDNYGYTGNYAYSYSCGSASVANTSDTSCSLSGAVNNLITVSTKNNRNISKSTSVTVDTSKYVEYKKPTMYSAAATRKDGIDAETKLDFSCSYFAGKFGSNGVQNTVSKIEYYVTKSSTGATTGPYNIPLSAGTNNTETGTYRLNDYLIHANGSSGGFEVGSRYTVKLYVYDAQNLLDYASVNLEVTDGKIARDVYQDDNGNYHEGINGRADSAYAQKVHGNLDVEGTIYKNGQEFGVNLLQVYPVGSVYMSMNSTDPGTLFGGTWERLKGGFLYGCVNGSGQSDYTGISTVAASGNTGASTGSTGGPSNNTSGGPSNNYTSAVYLEANQCGVPAHSHGASFSGTTHKFQARGGGSTPGQTVSSYSNTSISKNSGDTWSNTYSYYSKSHKTDVIYWTDGGSVSVNNNTAAKSAATHSHTLNSHTHTLSDHTHSLNSHTHSLNSHTHAVPYIAVFAWKRTA